MKDRLRQSSQVQRHYLVCLYWESVKLLLKQIQVVENIGELLSLGFEVWAVVEDYEERAGEGEERAEPGKSVLACQMNINAHFGAHELLEHGQVLLSRSIIYGFRQLLILLLNLFRYHVDQQVCHEEAFGYEVWRWYVEIGRGHLIGFFFEKTWVRGWLNSYATDWQLDRPISAFQEIQSVTV